jgi:transcriptional regulator with XRE-family HTH domain
MLEPRPDETIGVYLKRLRQAAGQAQGKPVTLNQLSQMSQRPPAAPQEQFTSAWLSMAESDRYKQIGGDKLRALAAIYSELLRVTIPAEWLLGKAGFSPAEAGLNKPDLDAVDQLLHYDDILALIGICGQLIEMGYNEDVRLLVRFAQRYLYAHNPDAQPGDLFDDPALSAHMERYMEALGL